MTEELKQSEQSEFTTHVKAAGEAARQQWKSLVPKEFWIHRRRARREMLLAMRSLVDSAITHLEDGEPEEEPVAKPKPRRRTTKQKVEVDDSED